MIAKYKDQYFCVDLTSSPKELWRYDYVQNFQKCIDGKLVYYSKFVDITEIDEIFDVGFSALWNGEWCGFEYSEELNKMEVYSNNPDFAKEYDMETVDRLFYSKVVPANSVNSFRITFEDMHGKITNYKDITLEELPALWKQFKTDLMPH